MEENQKPSCSCCSGKKTLREEEEKKKLLNRLKRIEGQIRGIQSMLEKAEKSMTISAPLPVARPMSVKTAATA